MGVSERREREKADLRGKIFDAARHLFAAEGYESVSMRRIAEAIEYSPTAIYNHFKDKADLFREICQQDFGALAASMHKLAAEPDAVERVRRIGREYIHFAVNHPGHYRLMFMTPGLHDLPRTEPEMTECGRGKPDEDSYAFLQTAVAEVEAAGRLRPPFAADPELAAQTLWAGVHGVASLQIAKHEDPWVDMRPLEARGRAMCDVMIEGMMLPASVPLRPRKRKIVGGGKGPMRG